MTLNMVLGTLAVLSLGLLLWQWAEGRGFPLHRRQTPEAFPPGITLLKPLKGSDHTTKECLRSWLTQDYHGPVQVLFGVGSASDPAGEVVEELLREFPGADAQLVICEELEGSNAKVCKLGQMERLARHEVLVISDADVRVPVDLLGQLIGPMREERVGLVNCFYRLANPVNLGMRWEALGANADFWSQVLQSRRLRRLDFALGAVMATRRMNLEEIGGFKALRDCLADDYQLGHRIAQKGHWIELCPVVVECWSDELDWSEVWKHQMRWARTIRVCQPGPYFLSILGNTTLWPVLWAAVNPSGGILGLAAGALLVRMVMAWDLERLLGQGRPGSGAWLAPIKDVLQCALWLLAFSGDRVEWRGQAMRLRRDGTLQHDKKAPNDGSAPEGQINRY